ncbi:hypothetical protein ACH5RR_028697 [Cinchona calisaya]|uniref:Isopenicillin N synthase-like Fe(2+) 2OG dioxygenase domain-containing protein n=1 Tax=Cinchona calisaya TaxID=153742 RepID=A0ABD2YQY4_9GENT
MVLVFGLFQLNLVTDNVVLGIKAMPVLNPDMKRGSPEGDSGAKEGSISVFYVYMNGFGLLPHQDRGRLKCIICPDHKFVLMVLNFETWSSSSQQAKAEF